MLAASPRARELLADKGYDADWFRQTLAGAFSAEHPGRSDPHWSSAKIVMPFYGASSRKVFSS